MEAQSARSPCPALPCLAWVRCVGGVCWTQEDGVLTGLRGTVTHRRPRGLEAGSQGPCVTVTLEGWDRSGWISGFAQCPV